MITYQVEYIKDMWPSLQPLVFDHWLEVGNFKEDVPLDVDWEQYAEVNNQGSLQLITARNEDGILVGYCTDFILNHIHHKATRYALNDAFFVRKQYRRNCVGKNLLKCVENELIKKGVNVWIVSSKCNKPITKLFDRLGFKKTDEQYSKVM